MQKPQYEELGLVVTKIAMETKIYGVPDDVEWLIPEDKNFGNIHYGYIKLANKISKYSASGL